MVFEALLTMVFSSLKRLSPLALARSSPGQFRRCSVTNSNRLFFLEGERMRNGVHSMGVRACFRNEADLGWRVALLLLGPRASSLASSPVSWGNGSTWSSVLLAHFVLTCEHFTPYPPEETRNAWEPFLTWGFKTQKGRPRLEWLPALEGGNGRI